MMINYQGEDFTETEFYGREILEAIQLTNKFRFCCKVFQKIYFSVKLRKKTERTE